MDYRSMDTEALDRMLLDSIHELEQQKLVDHHFRQCHSLKEDNGLSFFLDLILIFLNDAEATMSEMAEIMYQEVVDFNKIYSYYIKLKGSSAWYSLVLVELKLRALIYAMLLTINPKKGVWRH
ncbi:histidine-containing phosphotransfer protein 1-like isoform X2 [Salvia miltiorrhiza]|uniref:histidine-containing phosphotransfer protein 1-like isoform X2 n=1 Tax=Salvia miltiorrhiza TaxID=226208 RepID=UPI0025AC0509|nr:histidine-containing phosphotransfer protein 1-like isoform X2 [Salvia miltiorrhiza]